MISLTSLALNFVVGSSSAKIWERVYDSTGALVKELGLLSEGTGVAPGVVTSTGPMQFWTTATNMVGSNWYAVEIECRASPGDSVCVYDLQQVVSYQ